MNWKACNSFMSISTTKNWFLNETIWIRKMRIKTDSPRKIKLMQNLNKKSKKKSINKNFNQSQDSSAVKAVLLLVEVI